MSPRILEGRGRGAVQHIIGPAQQFPATVRKLLNPNALRAGPDLCLRRHSLGKPLLQEMQVLRQIQVTTDR